jgi:hypothetical protein
MPLIVAGCTYGQLQAKERFALDWAILGRVRSALDLFCVVLPSLSPSLNSVRELLYAAALLIS